MGVSHLSLFCFFCICSVEREGGREVALTTMASCNGKSLLSEFGI